MGDDIDAVLDEVLVDACGEDEQLWAFRQCFEDEAAFPFPCSLVGCGMSSERSDQGPAQGAASGPETWATVVGVEWCWWDLWFCVLAAADFGGDLDRMDAEVVGRLRSPAWTGVSRSDVESKLSHLADLRARLAGAGIGPGDLDAAGRRPGVRPRARSKILKKPVQPWWMTAAMVETPRVRLERRARRGRWDSFPVDPAGVYERVRRSVEVRDFIHEDRTFALTRQLWDRLCQLDDGCRGRRRAPRPVPGVPHRRPGAGRPG